MTQKLTLWQTWEMSSVWVTEGRILCSLSTSCLVTLQSPSFCYFAYDGWFNCYQMITWICFVCLLTSNKVFKWKDGISRFPVSSGSAETLVRISGKLKHLLISCFLSNTSTANWQNGFMYVKVIGSRNCELLRHTVCSISVWKGKPCVTRVSGSQHDRAHKGEWG